MTSSVLNKTHATDTAMVTAQALPNIPPDSKGVLMQALGGNIRYTIDGTTATAAIGFRLAVGAEPTFYRGDLSLISVIEESTSADLQVAYFS